MIWDMFCLYWVSLSTSVCNFLQKKEFCRSQRHFFISYPWTNYIPENQHGTWESPNCKGTSSSKPPFFGFQPFIFQGVWGTSQDSVFLSNSPWKWWMRKHGNNVENRWILGPPSLRHTHIQSIYIYIIFRERGRVIIVTYTKKYQCAVWIKNCPFSVVGGFNSEDLVSPCRTIFLITTFLEDVFSYVWFPIRVSKRPGTKNIGGTRFHSKSLEKGHLIWTQDLNQVWS